MRLLEERIKSEGKVLPGNIIKVDGFLNHRVDVRLLGSIAEEFKTIFDVSKVTVVLTAEVTQVNRVLYEVTDKPASTIEFE